MHLQGLHPQLITGGFELARNKALEVLEEVKVKREVDRDILVQVARTSLRTKVHQELADLLTDVSSRIDFRGLVKVLVVIKTNQLESENIVVFDILVRTES